MIYGAPIRTVAPTAQPVGIDELMTHANLTAANVGSSDMELLDAYLRAAVDKIESDTGLGIMPQTWSQTFSGFGTPMILRRRPLLIVGSPPSVASIAYLDISGADQTLDPAFYRVTGVGSDKAPGSIKLVDGQTWPSTFTDTEAVTVTYTVGYTVVPELIKMAIKQTAATWYRFREDIHTGSSFSELPFTAEALLRDWRPLAVA